MRRLIAACVTLTLALSGMVTAQEAEREQDPWTGKYPMSFFTRLRTANTVGEDKLSVAVKLQSVGADEVLTTGHYKDLPSGSTFDTFRAITTVKYGWAKDHHLAVGIPYLWVDFESSSTDIDADGLSNIFVFEKWKVLSETRACPGVALDAWYYFPTGDPDEKLGTDESSVKLTAEMSKAWKHINVHLMPGFAWNLDGGCDVGTLDAGFLCPAHKKLLLGAEYNYTNKEDKDKGECHDIVPGFVWKPFKGASVKLGAVVNLDSDMKYRDDLGVAAKLFYKAVL